MKRILSIFLLMFMLIMPLSSPLKVFADAEIDEIVALNLEIENFDDFKYFDIYSTDLLLLSNQKVVKVSNEKTFFDDNNTTTGIYQPKFAVLLKSNIAIFDSLDRIQMFNKNFEYQTTYQYVEGATKYNLGAIVAVTKDYSGNIYMLDKTNQKILALKDGYITEIQIEQEFNFDDNSKIAVNPNGNILAIMTENKTLIFDLQTNQKLTEIDMFGQNVMFDYQCKLFILSSNKISSFDSTNFQPLEEKTLDVEIKFSCIDVETGKFYLLTDSDIYTFYSQNFSANASQEIAPVDIENSTLINNQVKFATTINKTELFATCVSFSSSNLLEAETLVMILKTDIEENQNMFYCLTILNGNQSQGYISKSSLNILDNQTENETFKTFCKNVDVHCYPTFNSNIIKTIMNENTEVVVLSDCYNFVDQLGNKYFAVQFDYGIGYVNQNYLQKTNQFESEMLKVEPTNSHSTEFLAYVLTTISLSIMVVFACILIAKKDK